MSQSLSLDSLEETSCVSPIIYLISNDGERMPLDQKAVKQSKLLLATLETDADTQEIPLTNITTKNLKKITEYMTYHIDIAPKEFEKPVPSDDISEFVLEWDAAFIDMHHEELFALIRDAHFMDISSLLELCCAKVAAMVRGKSTQKLREMFNIVNDFTPQEEAAAIAETKWVEEQV